MRKITLDPAQVKAELLEEIIMARAMSAYPQLVKLLGNYMKLFTRKLTERWIRYNITLSEIYCKMEDQLKDADRYLKTVIEDEDDLQEALEDLILDDLGQYVKTLMEEYHNEEITSRENLTSMCLEAQISYERSLHYLVSNGEDSWWAESQVKEMIFNDFYVELEEEDE